MRELEQWAGETAWPADRTLAIAGRCRGSLLRDWAELCRARFGNDAPATVREGLGALAADLTDNPPAHAWLPVFLQLRTTDLLVERYLGGDARRLVPWLLEDGARSAAPLVGAVLRRIGPAPVLRHAGRIHPHLYDVGTVRAEVGKGEARLECRGADLFDHPTWRMLHLAGQHGLFALCGATARKIAGEALPGGGFAVEVAWSRG